MQTPHRKVLPQPGIKPCYEETVLTTDPSCLQHFHFKCSWTKFKDLLDDLWTQTHADASWASGNRHRTEPKRRQIPAHVHGWSLNRLKKIITQKIIILMPNYWDFCVFTLQIWKNTFMSLCGRSQVVTACRYLWRHCKLSAKSTTPNLITVKDILMISQTFHYFMYQSFSL